MIVETEPNNYRAEEFLRDGRAVTIRALHSEDKALWQDVWEHLSPTSVYYRFFSPKKNMSDQEVAYFTQLDFITHVGLLAIVHDPTVGDEPAAVGRYLLSLTDENSAEIAFAVEDAYHGLGIGTLLLKHLSVIAKQADIKVFKAFVLAENRKMVEVFENCGMPVSKELKDFTMYEVKINLEDQIANG
ncbi:MAG: GNAT family N-acetyltransferase [Candidatus Melainabacteria bacterium]|nr:GNAT family N-acetyltransferase [Candidatus Melainabacteria bacterium]